MIDGTQYRGRDQSCIQSIATANRDDLLERRCKAEVCKTYSNCMILPVAKQGSHRAAAARSVQRKRRVPHSEQTLAADERGYRHADFRAPAFLMRKAAHSTNEWHGRMQCRARLTSRLFFFLVFLAFQYTLPHQDSSLSLFRATLSRSGLDFAYWHATSLIPISPLAAHSSTPLQISVPQAGNSLEARHVCARREVFGWMRVTTGAMTVNALSKS